MLCRAAPISRPVPFSETLLNFERKKKTDCQQSMKTWTNVTCVYFFKIHECKVVIINSVFITSLLFCKINTQS